MSNAFGVRAAAERGQQAAWEAGNTSPSPAAAASATSATPGWARNLQSTQAARHHRQMAIHALQSGDRGGHGATPDIKQRED